MTAFEPINPTFEDRPLVATGSSDSSSSYEGDGTKESRRQMESELTSGGTNRFSEDASTARPSTHRRRTQDFIDDETREGLDRLATNLSRTNTGAGRAASRRSSIALPDIEEEDPALDPSNKAFDLDKWLRKIVRDLDNENIDIRHTGVLFKDLSVGGTGSALQLQKTVGDFFMTPFRIGEMISLSHSPHKEILHTFNGVLRGGELLIVLGRPGAGCSTLLKSMTGELHGLMVEEQSTIQYNGIPQKQMIKEFKGEISYNQEVDKHFPHLTVGQTLEHAAAVRTPSHRLHGQSREEHVKRVVAVVMAVCGLSHTYNTKVGNDFVRGVSGGERKRVSIAEMILAGSPLSAWDNSTRGLDSATALKFVQTLRLSSDLTGGAHAVAIYQASQAIYDLFDKATVLYEGRQIYYGSASEAKAFFERQGWHCPARQTTGDFLTSLTNPAERQAKEGWEDRVPRTVEEFEKYWHDSPEFQALQKDIQQYEEEYPIDGHGPSAEEFRENKRRRQAKHTRPDSPYIISIPMQVKLNTKRAYQRIWGDISATASGVIMNLIFALIVGSLFYGTPDATVGFSAKVSVLFLAILLNALTAISEINSLYAQRPIVEKHASYAFYHPATEAIAGIVSDIPIKFCTAVVFNIILYFMAGLRREPGQFFLYFLITFMATFVMSAVFRTIAALTKTVSQAMTGAGILVLALVIYTGFVIAPPQMHPWFSWIRWINPIYYGFEILVANEFHGRDFTCSSIIPAYTPLQGDSWICSSVGAVAGQRTVSGDAYIREAYEYSYSHVWRNFGILVAFLIFFMLIYFTATELNSSTTSTAEVLVFKRGRVPSYLQKKHGKQSGDVEKVGSSEGQASMEEKDVQALDPQTDIFTWRDVVYDIEIKGEPRRLLDHAAGWVKPGTLTALMGVSGAGKTTLLDVLAQRTTMGVITGDMLVNGKPLDASFQRKTGYVQQQDLHLETATVRESLRFSAELRQPPTVSIKEKYEFVEEVIKMLNMDDFADAIVGVPGQGLNVEQRKLLTIGVELAAKPKLLLFLDEPTSGLDSQSSWAICAFLRKLADSGQAVLCTIHQPSAILFQAFDRLLFLAKGGKTVYFGNIGENSRTLLDYFEANGARKCDDEENPAEYMLEIVNKTTGRDDKEWNEIWNESQESKDVQTELDRIHSEKKDVPDHDHTKWSHTEFAMPFGSQLKAVTVRIFQQYWRMPSYIFAKWMLGTFAGLFIGFTFYGANSTQAGMQTVIYSVFMLTTIFSTLVQQIQPLFVNQRSLYEVRERPSKAYSWKAFLIANVVVEIPYQIITGILTFACFYYAVVGVQASVRQILVLLFVCQLFVYASSFAHMCIAAMPDAQTASAIVTLLVLMSLNFCGVLQTPTALPGFWIFMYRLSPFTYWIGGIVSTMLHGRQVTCSESETSIFSPPSGQTCGEYLAPYLQVAPGTLQNPESTSECRYCSISNADQFLSGVEIYWSQRWRNFGIIFAYIGFNIFVAITTYYLFRVKKWNFSLKKKSKTA